MFQGFQFITQGSQAANSSYNSLQVGLEKRFSRGLSFTANYTFSKSTDNAPQNFNATGPSDGGSYAYPWYFQNANLLDRVAVGTAIADRPPRRSVRALLTHTALTSDAGVERCRWTHTSQTL